VSAILKWMIEWIITHLPAEFQPSILAILRFCLLINNLALNQFDVQLFKDYLDRPKCVHLELEEDVRQR
jgi:hypothetical protein